MVVLTRAFPGKKPLIKNKPCTEGKWNWWEEKVCLYWFSPSLLYYHVNVLTVNWCLMLYFCILGTRLIELCQQRLLPRS